MTDDATLLRRYAEERSEADFAELVRRHLGLVYTAALRQVNGDTHLAQDVAQLVFTDLARKAGRLAGHRVLAGWLFTSTRFAAAKAVRGERRRQHREQEASAMPDTLAPDPAASLDWDRVRPVLDDALAELGESDRTAILLRYFEGRDYAEVGAQLAVSDNAARMRVDRALDRLRALLRRRGIGSTSAALAAALAGQAVAAPPAGLAASITGAALAGSAAGAGLATASFMSITHVQLGLAAAIVAAGTGTFVVQERLQSALQGEIAAQRAAAAEAASLRHSNRQLRLESEEVARLRSDDAELARLHDEATTLNRRLHELARAEAAARAARTAARATSSTATEPVAMLDAPPAPTFQTPPAYPFELRQAGVTGSAQISFVVARDGTVANVQAVKSTHPAFEAAAIEAVRQWKFAPGLKGGRAVNTNLTVPIVFQLSNGGGAVSNWF